jgi:hypothetical protein
VILEAAAPLIPMPIRPWGRIGDDWIGYRSGGQIRTNMDPSSLFEKQ